MTKLLNHFLNTANRTTFQSPLIEKLKLSFTDHAPVDQFWILLKPDDLSNTLGVRMKPVSLSNHNVKKVLQH